MNYLALLIPICTGYIANYYALKHDYKKLEIAYRALLNNYKNVLREKEGDNE